MQKTRENAHYGYIYKYQAFSLTHLIKTLLPNALPSYIHWSIPSRRGGRDRTHGCLQHGPQYPQRAGTGSLMLLPESPAQPMSPKACRNAWQGCKMCGAIQRVWYLTAPGILQGEKEAGWRKRDVPLWLSWCLPNTGENEQGLWMINQEPRTPGRRVQAQHITWGCIKLTTLIQIISSLLSSQDLICEM